MTNGLLHIGLLHETRQNHFCNTGDVIARSNACRSLVEEGLDTLKEAGAVTITGKGIHVTPEQRLRIAELAIMKGADPERVARELQWQEFEKLTSQILRREGYATANHFVFKNSERKYEIDVLGAKEPTVLCIDCKHWHHGSSPSKITAAATSQLIRTQSLSQVFHSYGKKHHIVGWHSVQLLPIVLTLVDLCSNMVDGVPVVSVFRLRDFLCQVGPCVDRLGFVSVPSSSQALLFS
jgi:hypothetical protein